MVRQLDDLFKLRWEERNRSLKNEFLQVRQEMNNRGLLNSSITIQNAYRVLTAEFHAERQLISKTILDHVKQSQKITKLEYFEEDAQKQLSERKGYLERKLATEFRNILNGLQNSAMVAPYKNLDELYQLAQRELALELHDAIVIYNRSFGSNLTEQQRNRFLNYPILAIVVLSVAVAGFVIGVLRLLGVITL